MASPSEKLAQSLQQLHKLQNVNGAAAIRAKDMPRTHRERLQANGFLREVMKGWYVPSRPDEKEGDSTAWYASFWGFAAVYLETRFRKNWSLSPEQSLSLHGGNWAVPRQLVVRSPRGGNKVVPLPHGTSLLDTRAALPGPADREEKDGLRVFSLESGLIECSPQYFARHATDVRAALAMVRDASGLLARLLDGEFKEKVDEHYIIDCRFPYEYDGGHVQGAINVSSVDDLAHRFLDSPITDKRVALIFHCEFSCHRAPTM